MYHSSDPSISYSFLVPAMLFIPFAGGSLLLNSCHKAAINQIIGRAVGFSDFCIPINIILCNFATIYTLKPIAQNTKR